MGLIYVINLDDYSDIGTHWAAVWLNDNNNVTYFDSFGVEHIPKEIKKVIKNKNIKTNIFRIQANVSIMCGYFYIGFIDFMLKGKNLAKYKNLFPPNNFKKKWWYNFKMDDFNKTTNIIQIWVQIHRMNNNLD